MLGMLRSPVIVGEDGGGGKGPKLIIIVLHRSVMTIGHIGHHRPLPKHTHTSPPRGAAIHPPNNPSMSCSLYDTASGVVGRRGTSR